MEINKLSTAKSVRTEQTVKKEIIKEIGLKEDVFAKEEKFNPDDAKQYLSSIQNKCGYKKFACEQFVTKIVDNVAKEPNKWTYVKQLATRDNISPYSLSNYFSNCSVEDLKKSVELAFIDDKKGNPKLDDHSIERVVSEKENLDLFNNVKTLAYTDLHPKNILKITKEKDLDCKKVAKNVNEMSNIAGDDLSEVIFARNKYSKGDYTINVIKLNGSEMNAMFDGNMNKYAYETIDFYKSKNNSYKIQKSTDLRTNTVSKIRYSIDNKGNETPTHEIRIVKDKNGKVQRTEYTSPSDVKGILNVVYRYPDGKEEVISSGTVDKKTGITTIKKNMLSTLGTKTEYLFEDDPQGNRLSDYKITDKNGNVLLQNSETFEVINENKFISSKNDKKYEITSDEDNVIVKDLSNPERKAVFKRGFEIVGEQNEIINVLKKMPGEELLKLKESVDELEGTKDILSSYASPGPDKRKIHSGDNLFAILHELGHSVDMKNVNLNDLTNTVKNAIFEDEKFNKIYAKEKSAFNKKFPDAQRNHIEYFINHETHYNGEKGGVRETIAESNALLTTAKSHEILAMRSQYLQQHFPETIAYLDKKLNEGKQKV